MNTRLYCDAEISCICADCRAPSRLCEWYWKTTNLLVNKKKKSETIFWNLGSVFSVGR